MLTKIKKPVSILLSLIMVFSMFAIVPLSASAAPASYLTFTAEQDGSSVTLKYATGTLQYSKNGSGWESYTAGTQIELASAGDSVRFRGKDATFNDDNHVSLTGKVACSGNVRSLRTDDDGKSQGLSNSCFLYMFSDCTGLTSAPELPETTLAENCYQYMFRGCTSLTTAPELPATNLAKSCYLGMFKLCTSLTTAPELPATNLAKSCYFEMFRDCTSLTTAPALPATNLAESCYSDMFSGCESLTTAPELPATTLAEACYENMFAGCSILTTAPELPATTLATYCYYGMFIGCGSLTTAPELPATTLAEACYFGMFASCGSLTTAPELPAETLASGCYQYMFYGCSGIKLSETQTAEYSIPYSVPSGGNGTDATDALASMFAETGGTFTGTPVINKTYYLYREAPTYTVTWKNWDDTVIGTSTVDPGETPAFSDEIGEIKAKPADDDYTYTFSGWTPEVVPVTGDATYTATFDANPKYETGYYLVGTMTETAWAIDPAYKLAQNPENEAEYMLAETELTEGDAFKVMYVAPGQRVWYPDNAPDAAVSSDGKYDVYFRPDGQGGSDWYYGCIFTEKTKYTITWKNDDGTVIDTTTVAYGEVPTHADATKDATAQYTYTFTGWDTEPVAVTGDAEYTATFSSTVNEYTITWKNGDDTIETDENVPYGETPSFDGEEPTKEEDADNTYTFSGWSDGSNTYAADALPAVSGDVTYTATFDAVPKAIGDYDSLTFTAEQDGSSVTIRVASGSLQYNKNGSGWESYTAGTPINLDKDDYVRFRGKDTTFNWNNHVSLTGKVAASGNVMSLRLDDDFNIQGLTNRCFEYMFYNCTGLTTAPELPETMLAQSCYNYMFYGCTSLTKAPDLPATNLAEDCYSCMFKGCTSLTTAPELPATNLADSCYQSMFEGCKSLTTAPALPATTLAESCYAHMFEGCTSLTTAPALPATTLAEECYYNMFRGCTSLTTAPAELPATNLANTCYYGMFAECGSLTTAPELPATNLAAGCYYCMFMSCTSLTTAPELPATNLAESCYFGMFAGCTSLTTAPELPATNLAAACYFYMFMGCEGLTTAPELPATTLAAYCYGAMFSGCLNLTTAPALPATTLEVGCYSSMFEGCTSLTTAPALPATTLAEECYYGMFAGCSGIKLSETQTAEYSIPYSVPSGGNGTDASYALNGMFEGTGGTFTGTPEINKTYYLDPKLFIGHSVTLGGDIGVNFYLDSDVLDTYSGTKTVKFTVDGEETTVDVPATPTANGYKVTRNVVAAQMAHKITATLCVDGEAVDTDDYSVQDYAEKVYANPATYDSEKPEQLKAVAEALLHYGAMAQTVFAGSLKETPDHLADVNMPAADFSGATAENIAAAIKGSASDLNAAAAAFDAEFYTSSLIYLSRNTLRLYFTPASKTVGALDGKGFDGALSDYYYYVDKANIAAAELDNQQEFSVNGTEFTFSALDYVKAVVESTKMTDTQKNLAKSLFQYNQAANAYFDPASPVENVVDLSTLTAAYEAQDGDVLINALSGDYQITIAAGATVTLRDATITCLSGNANFAGITPLGNATILLEGTNVVKGGFSGAYADLPGIFAPEGYTLTIDGTGSLTASKGDDDEGAGCGIGGGYGINAGNIVIKGGNVTAIGGWGAAGIGSGYKKSCGNITIADTVTQVTATKGSEATNSIGAGLDGTCGTVTIGGVEGAITESPYTYPAPAPVENVVDLSTLTAAYEAQDGDVLINALSGDYQITIAAGATITLRDVTITCLSGDAEFAGITPLGDATILLEGENTVKGGHEDYPGIFVPENTTLTIDGTGSLTASSGGTVEDRYGCGIGGGYEINAGNIEIKGGNITAIGGWGAAGIGGNNNASCGAITITGGNVTATGGSSAAGIGSGYFGSCGSITINGGIVNATGCGGAAGIGSGYYGSCVNITIADTVTSVTATKGEDAPNSIGAGGDGTCGTVTIDGAVVDPITQSPYTYEPN